MLLALLAKLDFALRPRLHFVLVRTASMARVPLPKKGATDPTVDPAGRDELS
jgi:hypothetical protein